MYETECFQFSIYLSQKCTQVFYTIIATQTLSGQAT